MDKNECVEIFNSMIKNISIPLDKLFLLISEYLSDNKIKNSDKLMKLITELPHLTQYAMPVVIEHFEKKFNIFSIIYNKKIIYYYVSN